MRIEALNHALAGLPEDRVRYHMCWGSWHGPHTTDAPLREIAPVILQIKAGAFSSPISAPVSTQLYRIVQEALHNAVEHGHARQVWIDLGFNHQNLVLTIRDDGKGFDASTDSDGMGLRIMQYRAQCIGGSCEVQSNCAKGTIVTCRVPLQADAGVLPIP